LALGVSVVIAGALCVDRGRLLFNARDGVALWLEWSNDLIDLPRALPSLFRDTPGQAWLKAGILGACFAGAWLAQTALERRSHPNAGSADRWYLSWRSIWLFGTATMLALTLAWQADGVSPMTPATGELGLLRSASRLRPLAFDYGEMRAYSSPARLSQIRIKTDRQRRSVPAESLLSVRDVPAGTYQIFAEGAAPSSIRLPVTVSSLTIEGADPSVGAIPSAELTPARGGAYTFGRPVLRGVARRIVSYGSTRAFFMDDFAYAEAAGFWVAGKRRAQIVLSSDSPSERRRLYLRNIPFANHLRISIGGERRDISLNPREETEIELPSTPLDIVLRVETDAGIRPSQM